jgi:hypothetical protein
VHRAAFLYAYANLPHRWVELNANIGGKVLHHYSTWYLGKITQGIYVKKYIQETPKRCGAQIILTVGKGVQVQCAYGVGFFILLCIVGDYACNILLVGPVLLVIDIWL